MELPNHLTEQSPSRSIDSAFFSSGRDAEQSPCSQANGWLPWLQQPSASLRTPELVAQPTQFEQATFETAGEEQWNLSSSHSSLDDLFLLDELGFSIST
jgi:hypothetical protein